MVALDEMLNKVEHHDMTEFVLNGVDVRVADEHPHLLAALREELGVTSPKDGCSPSGQCGCCAVLVDGKAVLELRARGVDKGGALAHVAVSPASANASHSLAACSASGSY
jgi:hypothetical protein